MIKFEKNTFSLGNYFKNKLSGFREISIFWSKLVNRKSMHFNCTQQYPKQGQLSIEAKKLANDFKKTKQKEKRKAYK